MHFRPDTPFGRPGRPGWLLCIILFLLHISILPAEAAEGHLLVVEDDNGKVLYSAPVRNGSVFAIRYLHSVALSPVTDFFVVCDNDIWLDKTEYQDFGAGLPHEEGPGQKMAHKNGKLVLSGFNRKLGSFQLRTGRIANHVLLLLPAQVTEESDWFELPLNEIAKPGSAVTFAVRSEGK